MDKKNLKYPVVLVHGVMAKDNNLFWGQIPEKLKNAGVKVFLGNTDSWSGIESNAFSLKKTVDSVLAECEVEKVNLIAHSKGGIDARYLISTLEYAPKIASLTTISTPHLGCEAVDYIFDKKYIHTELAKKITYFFAKLYGDKSPNPHKLLEDLTTKNMHKFNQRNLDANSVYYSSYQSVMKNGFDDLTFLISYNLIKKIAGENDGVVSLKSAQWGKNCTLITGLTKSGISHAEIIDIKRRKISGINIPDEYLKIIDKLKSMEF